MNLKQLEYAVAVAARQSFSAAAEDCHVTQPTLSNGVAELEEELGGRLFSRTTRHVTLTPFGTHLIPYAREVLRARATLLGQARAFLDPARQMIRIGVSPLLDSRLLGHMLEPFRREHPGIALVLREMNMADLYRLLDEGLLDYVCGVADDHKAGRNTALLYDEPLLYIPSGAEPRGDRAKPVNLGDIAGDTFVMVPDACGLARATRTLFRSHRKTLNEYSGQALSYQVLEDWAMLNVGAAILPQSKVTRSAASVRTIRSRNDDIVRLGFEVVWPKNRPREAPFAAFERHLRAVAPKVARGLARS